MPTNPTQTTEQAAIRIKILFRKTTLTYTAIERLLPNGLNFYSRPRFNH